MNDVFSSIVSARKPYGFRADIFNKHDLYKDYWTNENDKESYKIYGVAGKKGAGGRKEAQIKSKFIKVDMLKNKNKYKLFFSKAFSFSPPYITIPKIILAKPKEVCSETFLSIGCFDTKVQAENCLSYIETKFWRYLFKLYWSGQNVSKKNFSLIPLMDFNKSWTDKELYEYFKLSKEEIDYIENLIGEFDNGEK